MLPSQRRVVADASFENGTRGSTIAEARSDGSLRIEMLRGMGLSLYDFDGAELVELRRLVDVALQQRGPGDGQDAPAIEHP